MGKTTRKNNPKMTRRSLIALMQESKEEFARLNQNTDELSELIDHLRTNDSEELTNVISDIINLYNTGTIEPINHIAIENALNSGELLTLVVRHLQSSKAIQQYITEHFGQGVNTRRNSPKLLHKSPQQTSPEIKEATIAMADAPLFRGWALVDGEIALRHSIKESQHQIKFVISPLVQWLGRPNTVESLWDELREMGLPAALLYHVVIAEILEHGSTIVAIDSLITAIGWDPRSTAERQEMRQTLWRWIVCFVSWEIVGKRRSMHKDPVTKQPLDLATFTPMIRLGERGYNTNTQIALDYSTPPFEVELEASSWLAQFRGNDNVLWYFGDVRRLAGIKAGKPSGAWAQAIGLALQQLWRERASRAEVTRVGDEHKPTVRFNRSFTRRELLGLFAPQPTADEVLGSANPKRAQAYWTDAIGLLKGQEVIGYYEEPKTPLPRQGWAQVWLDQPLDIRPTREGIAAVIEIATKKREADKRRKRAGGKKADSAVG